MICLIQSGRTGPFKIGYTTDRRDFENLQCPGRDSNPRRAIENLLQDAWLPSIALLLFTRSPVRARPVASRSIPNRAGVAHVWHKTQAAIICSGP